MKRRLFLPLHLFILFATLLAAGCWCPRADAHEPEKGAFRHAPTQYETVIQDVYQPLLIQTEVRVPHVRGHELSQRTTTPRCTTPDKAPLPPCSRRSCPQGFRRWSPSLSVPLGGALSYSLCLLPR
ncbi:MAG: hypothetical protein ACLSAH_16675 [Bilophila wadsworthia]